MDAVKKNQTANAEASSPNLDLVLLQQACQHFESIVNEPDVTNLATQRAKDLLSSLAGPIYARLSFYVRNGTAKASAWTRSAMPLP